MKAFQAFYTTKETKLYNKAVKAMDSKGTVQCNKLIQLENSMLMYGIYNADMLETYQHSKLYP